MEDKRKGNEIFLGIVGVATLIVAIIGASFAYFSAQASSVEGAVNLTAYEFNATLSMRELLQSNKEMIPLKPDALIASAQEPNNTNLRYALNVAKKCEDSQGFRICALYEVTIRNGGTTNITLNGSIVTNTNEASEREGATPFSNLTYRGVTYDEANDTFIPNSTIRTLDQTVGGSTPLDTITVNAGQSATTYVLLYLNDNEDQSSEMGAKYTGQIVYTSTAGNGTQLTGTFTIGG